MGYRIIQSQETDIQISTSACASKEKARECDICVHWTRRRGEKESKIWSGQVWGPVVVRSINPYQVKAIKLFSQHDILTWFMIMDNHRAGHLFPISECGWEHKPNRKYWSTPRESEDLASRTSRACSAHPWTAQGLNSDEVGPSNENPSHLTSVIICGNRK